MRTSARFAFLVLLAASWCAASCAESGGRARALRWQMVSGLEGQIGPGSAAVCDSRCDLQSSWLGAAARAIVRTESQARFLGHATIRARSLQITAGDVAATWAAGCVLAEASPPFGFREPSASGESFTLRTRGTLASSAAERGITLALAAARLSAGAWRLHDQRGAGLGYGPVSLAAGVQFIESQAKWTSPHWSIALHLPTRKAAGTERGGSLLIEAAGCWPDHRVRALGGAWDLALASFLGGMRGSFIWFDPRRTFMGATPDAFWSLHWDLGRMGGIQSTISLLVVRSENSRDPIPPIERATRLALKAAPWSGATIGLGLTSEESQRCQRDPADDTRHAIVRGSRSVLDFSLDADAAAGAKLAIRYRLARETKFRAAADTPVGLGSGRVIDEDPLELGGEQSWSERAAGSLACASLQWIGERTWGGARFSVTERDAGGTAIVAIREADGRAGRLTLGSGAWMIESWIGRRVRGWRIEGVARAVLNTADGAEQASRRITILIGLSRSFG